MSKKVGGALALHKKPEELMEVFSNSTVADVDLVDEAVFNISIKVVIYYENGTK